MSLNSIRPLLLGPLFIPSARNATLKTHPAPFPPNVFTPANR